MEKRFPVKPEFTFIYEKYYDRIYKYVYMMLLNKEDAEDVVSDTFMSAYMHYDSYDPAVASPATWLSRIAHNRALNLLRSGEKSRRASMPDYYEPADPGADIRMEGEDREALLTLYSELSEDEREFLNFRYVMGLSDNEVAEITELNPRAVNKRYQRLREKCRGILEKNGYGR
jgi:RNA polymerase sigma-70 factor (ECF subfamily)